MCVCVCVCFTKFNRRARRQAAKSSVLAAGLGGVGVDPDRLECGNCPELELSLRGGREGGGGASLSVSLCVGFVSVVLRFWFWLGVCSVALVSFDLGL